MSRSLILSLLLLSPAAFAQNKFMAIMGGGAEPQDRETTIFDKDVKEVGEFVNKNKSWQPTITFNGGHTVTEGLIAEGVGRRGVSNTQFTQEQYAKTLDEYILKINAGEIKSGDQLLVWISTHGAIQQPGETTHQISTTGASASDLTSLQNATLVDLDRIKVLRDVAESKGVKLGILDFSCHSGASMALGTEKTCVISSSGPKHFGYSNWGGIFGNNLKRGKNLEEVFLETLNERDDPAFPMISTEVGKSIQDEIYPLATPFFYTWKENVGHNKLTPFLEDQVKQNMCEEADRSYDALIQFSLQVEERIRGDRRRGPKYDRFREAVTEYHTLLKQMRDDLTGMNINDLETKTLPICAPYYKIQADGSKITEQQCMQRPWNHKQLLAMDFAKELQRLENQKAGKSPQDVEWIETQKLWYQQAQTKTAELIATNPDYQKYKDYYKSIPGLQDRTWQLASNVSKKTQELYTDLYEHESKNDSRPNPCKDFVL